MRLMDFIGNHNYVFSMLDCMCEAGVAVHILRGAWHNERVFGLENDPDAFEYWDYKEAFIDGDVHDIPNKDGSFHIVSMFNWDRVEDWDKALSEMKRVCKGIIYTGVPESLDKWSARAIKHGLLTVSPYEDSTRTMIFKKE